MTKTTLREDLASVGVKVGSVWDLVQRRDRYDAALPVLIQHLETSNDRSEVEGIARALTARWASSAVPALVRQFPRWVDGPESKPRHTGWAIGNAINQAWREDQLDDVLALAAEPAYGSDRAMIVDGLWRAKRPEARELLEALLDDDSVQQWAVYALGRLATPADITLFERVLAEGTPGGQREARKVLKKLHIRKENEQVL